MVLGKLGKRGQEEHETHGQNINQAAFSFFFKKKEKREEKGEPFTGTRARSRRLRQWMGSICWHRISELHTRINVQP